MNLETGSNLSYLPGPQLQHTRWNKLSCKNALGTSSKAKRASISLCFTVSVNIITTSSFLNYCNICPGQHATQWVSELARSTVERQAESNCCSHLELMPPILQTQCSAWTSLSPCCPAACSRPCLPHPLQTISPISRAPGPIYFPSNACQTQTETRNGHEHSLTDLPAGLQQKHSKPLNTWGLTQGQEEG